ncbi:MULTISPECIES: hypothetical protein [Gordonia]|uniref:hypothetical protein n=1 Tax=Gordonia TaxID=2053 RepID=UPI001E5D382D|nr:MULTISPECIES: hypothetical protein [Gordonia]
MSSRASGDHLRVDLDQVHGVVSFYRRASLVVGAAASDMESAAFGRWCSGEAYATLAERYVAMGDHLAQRLRTQSIAAADLADMLERGMSRLDDADADLAPVIRRAAGSDPGTARPAGVGE